jgi:hypothetical protein
MQEAAGFDPSSPGFRRNPSYFVGPTNVYHSFPPKLWLHVIVIFVCVSVGLRDMENPKRVELLTRVVSVASKW